MSDLLVVLFGAMFFIGMTLIVVAGYVESNEDAVTHAAFGRPGDWNKNGMRK